MEVFKEVRREKLRKKAIDELIEAQNKIISDCREKYNYYIIQLEKINILEDIDPNYIANREEKNKFDHEISSALNEATKAIELKNELEKLD